MHLLNVSRPYLAYGAPTSYVHAAVSSRRPKLFRPQLVLFARGHSGLDAAQRAVHVLLAHWPGHGRLQEGLVR